MRQLVRRSATLRRLYYRWKLPHSHGQSDESQIIASLAHDVPRTFVEIGFHPIEFNCVALAQNPDWQGLLVDCNARQVADARAIFPSRIKAVEAFLTLDNLDFIKSSFPEIGVFSLDVDGNDYWFLEKLIEAKPSVICVEYNATLGLEPITIPYDPAFDRYKHHAKGWYHGASLTALAKLCAAHGYGLAAVSQAGINAFFTREGSLDPRSSWRPNTFREQFHGVPHQKQWEEIKGMKFVPV